MPDKFTWKGEITFRGTADEFAKLAGMLDGMPIEVEVHRPPWWPPGPFPGFPPPDWWGKFPQDRLDKIIAGSPRMKVRFLKDFAGGIRDPHLHLGNEVVVLNRDQFRTLVTEVAGMLAADLVTRTDDFSVVMGGLKELDRAANMQVPGA